MSRYSAFFATKQDSLDLLLSIEKRSPLFYVRWGHYPSRQVPTYETASDLPDLGTPEFGGKGDNRYLVLPNRSALAFSRYTNDIRGVTYVTQSRGYSPYVFFHSGGIYRGECLITGEVETNFDTREVLCFFHRFYRALRERFTRGVWGAARRGRCDRAIGPEALSLLRGGMRFTDDYARTPESDYKLPPGWRPAGPGAAPDRGRQTGFRALRHNRGPGS
jgi:hypothetical protein